MTIRELIPVLDARVLCGEDKLDQEVKSACGSDLMSDVLCGLCAGKGALGGNSGGGKGPGHRGAGDGTHHLYRLRADVHGRDPRYQRAHRRSCVKGRVRMSLLTNTYDVHKGEFETAGDASASIKRKLKQLGVDSAILRRVAVASYEAELNLIIHSLGGQLTMEMNPEHIVLISRDVGPGIADIDKAMQEGFSTASEEARDLGFGAGMGLPNMRRNADGFSIESQPGVGTTIQMEFRLK